MIGAAPAARAALAAALALVCCSKEPTFIDDRKRDGGATGGQGGAGAVGGSAGAGGTGTGASGGSSDGGACDALSCQPPRACCAGVCVNEKNDIFNCGACFDSCAPPNPYCNAGVCDVVTCSIPCAADVSCCGDLCCAVGELCCDPPTGPYGSPVCVKAQNGTCPG